MSFRSRNTFPAIAALALCVAAAAHAQSPKDASTIVPDSRVDIYAGYAYIHPINSDIHYFEYQPVENLNATVSVSAYFTRHVGLQVEGAYFSGNAEHAGYDSAHGVKCFDVSCDQLYYTAEAGPVFRMSLARFVPFAHIWRAAPRSTARSTSRSSGASVPPAALAWTTFCPSSTITSHSAWFRPTSTTPA